MVGKGSRNYMRGSPAELGSYPRARYAPSAMALVEIVCPHCQHSGHVSATTLPRVLYCYACGDAHTAAKGRQIVRSRLAHEVDDQVYPTHRHPRIDG
jgi:hypothetical protein